MYNMRAEHLATGNSPGLLWHVLNCDGRALCGRPLEGKATVTVGAAMEREDYCRRCMNDAAVAIGARRAGVPVGVYGGGRRA